MLKFLKGLFSGWTPVDGDDNALARDPDTRVHYANLILSEVKLYDGKLLQGLSHDLALQPKLKTSLQRSYQMYVDRTVGNAGDRETIFRESAVRILANGNTSLLEPSLSEVLREARDRAGQGERLPDED